MCSGDDVSDTTRRPDECAAARSARVSTGPPSGSSRKLSTTVRTSFMPSDVVTCPVTVSASSSRTFWPLRIWSAEARFVAIVVLPTPPFGLKTAMTVARAVQLSASSGPLCRTGPGAVVDGLAADAHRLDPPAQGLGGVGAREVLVLDAAAGTAAELIEGPRRDDHERGDGPPGVAQQPVVLE